MAIANAIGIVAAFWALFFSMGAGIRRGSEDAVATSEVIKNAPRVVTENFFALGRHLLAIGRCWSLCL